MIWVAALLAAAAAGPATIYAEQLGAMTEDCGLRDEQPGADVGLAEAERFADCLVTYDEDTGPAEEGRVFLERSCVPDEATLRKLINETYRLMPDEPFEDVDD